MSDQVETKTPKCCLAQEGTHNNLLICSGSVREFSLLVYTTEYLDHPDVLHCPPWGHNVNGSSLSVSSKRYWELNTAQLARGESYFDCRAVLVVLCPPLAARIRQELAVV